MIIGWVSNFTLLELLVVGKKGEKIEILALELGVLPNEKMVFIYCLFVIHKIKVDKIKLLVYQKSQYLTCCKFYSI